MQGFTQLHFTPLEVLAIIEGIQRRVGKTFSREEIESGILEKIIIEEDYNIECIVSCIWTHFYLILDLLHIWTLSYRDILIEPFLCQCAEHQAEKKKALSDEAKRLYRKDPGLFKAAKEDFKSISFISLS